MSLTPTLVRESAVNGWNDPWVYELTVSEADELESALEANRGRDPLDVGPEQFQLRRLGPHLNKIARSLEHSPGFGIVRGFPVQGKSEEDTRLMAWGIGLYIGVPLAQKSDGTYLVDVRAEPGASSDLRGHSSNRPIGFHIDSCDVFTLLCGQNSTRGGASIVSESETVRRELSWVAPELLSELYAEDIPFADLSSRPGETPDIFRCPVFGRYDEWPTCRFYRSRIVKGHDHPSAGEMSAQRRAAIDLLEEVAGSPNIRKEFRLEPGDLQMVNNHLVLHARTAFEDPEDDLDGRRHLLRMWYSVPWSRPLPASFDQAWGTTNPGALRGSVRGWQLKGKLGEFQRSQAARVDVALPLTQTVGEVQLRDD